MTLTKTLIPQRRGDTLYRQRLVEKMRGRLERALTLVSAPAGYGKTSLLLDLCYNISFPVCWLSLDESDRDFHAFVLHLIAAIQHRFPDFGGPTLRALDANSNPKSNLAALCDVFVRDLADSASEYFVLVLDDYHKIDRLRDVGALLSEIVKFTGRQWHVITSGRTVPDNLPAVYLMANDLITFISQEDLAFTGDEVQQVLGMKHNLTITREQAEELVAASEGWIMSITLATGGAWSGMRDILLQARAQGGLVYTYLADYAFKAQPEALRETMLDMSTLVEMSTELCRQALGLKITGSLLPELERRGVFLTKVKDNAGVLHYRYHHLFRDFLQERLRGQNLERFRQLHQRAAGYFETQEQWDSAVLHRRAAGYERIMAQTMENGAKAMYLAGRLDTLVAWYEAVPEPLRPEFPRLLLFVGRALYDLSRVGETIPILHQAETSFLEQGEMESAIAAMLQISAVRYVQGRYAEMLDVARESLVMQDAPNQYFPVLIAEAHRLIGFASLYLGQAEEAVKHLRKALDLHQELGTEEIAVTYLDLSLALLRLGRLNEGWACQDRAIELYRSADFPSWRLAMTLNNVACERYYLTGDYGQALTCLQEALDVARATGSPQAQAFALLSIADIYRDLGALEKAQEFYAQAEDAARRLSQADLLNFALLGSAQTLIQVGDLLEAQSRASQARDQSKMRGDTYQLGSSHLTLGAVYLAVGDAPVALAEIERGRDILQKNGSRRDLTRAYMLLARAHQAAGDVEAAIEALKRALNIGIETKTYHYLVVEGQHVFDLLKLLQQRNPTDGRLTQIIDRIWRLPTTAQELVGGSDLTELPRCPTLYFCGFGPGHIERDGQVIELKSAKARRMIFYLLTHKLRSRDQILAVFWPDVDENAARLTFHTTKYQANKALGQDLIVYQDGSYKIAWDPGYQFDVVTFELLLDRQEGNHQARLERAVSLYRGDFLEGYDAEWCLPIRELLRMRYRDTLLELGEIYLEKKDLSSAVLALRQAVAVDDLYEPAARALMHLYILDGQPRESLNLFRQLEQRLQGIQALPERETQLLCESIQASL